MPINKGSLSFESSMSGSGLTLLFSLCLKVKKKYPLKKQRQISVIFYSTVGPYHYRGHESVSNGYNCSNVPLFGKIYKAMTEHNELRQTE